MATAGGSRRSSKDSDVLGSIIIIIVVVLVTTTTLNYSAQNQTSSGSASSASSTSSVQTSTTSTTSSTTTLSSSRSSSSSTSSTTSTTSSSGASGALTWLASTDYPTSAWLQSCAASGPFVYCVGGVNSTALADAVSSVYYAQLSDSGVEGQWTSTTSYPEAIRSESCVTSQSHLYCIGGYTASVSVDSVYYTTVSGDGVGRWINTTSYPLTVGTLSCAASGNGVYCVGGTSSRGNPTNATYFAPFTSDGLGNWTATTQFPIAIRQESCVASATDLYCVGGYESDAVYFASLTDTGLGEWRATTSYPLAGAANLLSCSVLSADVYCVGGSSPAGYTDAVYFAPLSSSGVGVWAAGGDYPVALWGESCVSYGEALYCVGGESSTGSVVSEIAYGEP